MKKLSLLLLALTLSFITYNCSETHKQTKESITKITEKRIEEEKIPENEIASTTNNLTYNQTIKEEDSLEEQFIENNKLLDKLIDGLYTIEKDSIFNISKETFRNRHTDADVVIMDTLVTYSFDKTYIKFYKTGDKEWIFEGKIGDDNFNLFENLYVGIKKEQLQKLTEKPLTSDTIKIGNLEQTSVFTFFFKNDILTKIDYDGYVD